jgi:hypothetical protein
MEVYEKQYAMAFRETTRAAIKVPVEKRMKQAAPEKAHPLWLLGHLTVEADTVVGSILFGKPITVPEDYIALFSPDFLGGAPVSNDAATYPAWDILLAQYKTVTARVLEIIATGNFTFLVGVL